MKNLIKKIKQILVNKDFKVQEISYEDLISSGELEYLKDKELIDLETANFLRFFPDIFVMHEHIEPKKGIFFGFVEDADSNLIEKNLKKYFPEEIIKFNEESGRVKAKRLNDEKYKSIDEFLSGELDINGG